MFIIIEKRNNIVIDAGPLIHYNAISGNPCLTKTMATYPADQVIVQEVKNMPENFTPRAWKFVNGNFYNLETLIKAAEAEAEAVAKKEAEEAEKEAEAAKKENEENLLEEEI